MSGGEYRCPNCMKAGKPGLLLAWEQVGIHYAYGLLVPELPDEPLRLVCLPCYANNVAGLHGERGLVAVRNEMGWLILKPE